MGAMYFFFLSLGGIVFLLSLKVSELRKGAKPFSVMRYRLDVFSRRLSGQLKEWFMHYVNARTIRLILAYLVAIISTEFTLFVRNVSEKVKQSHFWKTVKGKVTPGNNGGAVSAFLRDVAEFKKEAAGEIEKKEKEEQSEEVKNNK